MNTGLSSSPRASRFISSNFSLWSLGLSYCFWFVFLIFSSSVRQEMLRGPDSWKESGQWTVIRCKLCNHQSNVFFLLCHLLIESFYSSFAFWKDVGAWWKFEQNGQDLLCSLRGPPMHAMEFLEVVLLWLLLLLPIRQNYVSEKCTSLLLKGSPIALILTFFPFILLLNTDDM